VHEVPGDIVADRIGVGPVDLVVVECFFRLGRYPGAVVHQAEGIFENEVGDPTGVHQREACSGHPAGGVAEDGHLPDPEVVQQCCGVGGEELEAVVDIWL
jgi:hypothetical protein